MACCALKKKKQQLLILPLLLFLLTAFVGGLFIALLSIGSFFSNNIKNKRKNASKLLKELMNGLMDRILDKPFIFNSNFRCKVSSKMMRYSSQLAGSIYKYFNLVVLAIVVLSLLLLIQGIKKV